MYDSLARLAAFLAKRAHPIHDDHLRLLSMEAFFCHYHLTRTRNQIP